MAEQGYEVICGVRKKEDVQKLLKEAKERKVEGIHPIILDVTKEGQVEEAVKSVEKFLLEKKEELVSIVNNAGVFVQAVGEFTDIEDAKVRK